MNSPKRLPKGHARERDRIAAIYKGLLSPLKSMQDTNRDKIGHWMGSVVSEIPQHRV